MNATQRKIEALIIALTVVVAISVVAMFIDSAAIMFLVAPVSTAVLLYLAVVEAPAGAGKSTSLIAIHIFNLVHTAIWVAMLVTLPLSEASFWGLPPASGLLLYVFWPLSAVVASLLYAFVSKQTGVIDRLEQEDQDAAATTATKGERA